MAETLGTGHHVLARVRTGKTYRGHIGTIGREELTLLQDHARGPVTIAYAEMDHLEQNLSLKAKIAIAAAIGGGIAFLIYFRTVIDHDE